MALIRMPKQNGLDELPNFYDPAQGMPPQVSQTPPPSNWNLYTTPTSAIPIPQTSAPTPWDLGPKLKQGASPQNVSQGDTWAAPGYRYPQPGERPVTDPNYSPPSTPPASQNQNNDTWENNWNHYWAPDRREKLLSLLERDYHAADKQQRIDWLKNLSDAELWPHGKPGGDQQQPAPPATPPPPQQYQAPPGVDQTKLNNPQHLTDKYRAVRILLGGGGIDDVLKELGAGWTKVSNDAIRAPDGSIFDLYFDFGGPQQRVQWTQVGAPGSTPPPPTPPGTPPAPGQPPAMPPTQTAPNLQAPPGPGQTPQLPPLVTPQQSQIPTISWQPGSAYGWQKDPTSQAVYAQVANALAQALGRAPTPEEVWAQLNYDQRPDKHFLQQIIAHIQQTVKPAPTQQQAPATDPYVEEYQRYLDEYLKTLASQRSRWEQDNESFRQRQQQAQQATERLIAFLEERSKKLLQPAYTGAEGEVFRTQALDPIESDRQAAKQRALQRISQRGLDPNSGIAQELLNQVDAAFDKSRAGTQNQLAYRQIDEQRSREQESQQLLSLIPTIQRAAINGDIELLDQLDQQIRNTYREGMGPAQSKYNIPTDALQQALAALGLGPNPMQLMQMLMNQQNYNQHNSNALWGSWGSMLPYILGAFGGNNRMPTDWTGGT